ncbi:hypothetical protein FB446DRAFT_709311 [Lentinula raphanica]|nr:hypothetical protein FB446DRAFT_709311 [Lentinula raphanica]
MYDVQDSSFWDTIRLNLNSPYDLIFSVYVDWFNPLGNKQADFDLPGQVMQTSVNPDGTRISARVYPNIADLLASKKFTGFDSPSAKYFCTWCTLSKEDVESLDYNSWILQNGNTVRAQAQAWKNATTLSKKDKLFKQNGIRWIPQYNIPYFDPVLHVVLGMMHNVLEGHLEFHLRELWGLGRTEKKEKQLTKEETEVEEDEEFSEMDTEEALSELENLAEELKE